jgi:hypothetical protein
LVCNAIEKNPSASFPNIFGCKAELDGFYRLANNTKVNAQHIWEEACTATVKRARSEPEILALHDTTAFSFPSETSIEGLGRVTDKTQGFFGHFCVGVNHNRELLGLLGLKTWTRAWEKKGKRSAKEIRADDTNEKLRWAELVQDVEGKLIGSPNVIHVMDREADDYAVFYDLVEQDFRFVIRMTYDRRLYKDTHEKLFDALAEVAVVCEREVSLSRRLMSKFPGSRQAHPARRKRVAKLGFAAKQVNIRRGWHADNKLPRSLTLNVVRVFELEPPEGEPPVEWLLVTTEPIDTEENLLHIVDIYRARWIIEEYFKALKSGCAFEDRGLETLDGLLNCLAIFAPIACKLYSLKTMGRTHPENDYSTVITDTQRKVLQTSKRSKRIVIKNIADAMWAIAAMGGHLKHNGLPGWQVLARGYERLLTLEEGWLLASHQNPNMERSDM